MIAYKLVCCIFVLLVTITLVHGFLPGGRSVYLSHSQRLKEVGIRRTQHLQLFAASLVKDSPSMEFSRKDGIELAPRADLVEEPTNVDVGSVVEFVRSGELLVGVVSRLLPGTGGSLFVALPFNQSVRIGVDQVVSIWDDVEGGQQLTDANWQTIEAEAEALIANLPPRKHTLDEFWQHMNQQRSHKLAIDSVDVGVYLFQEGRFANWLNPYLPAEEAKVRPLTAAQRHAAALLLHRDSIYFKRRPTVTVSSVSENSLEPGLALTVVEGGYRVLEESQVLFKESALFERYYTEQLCDISQLEAAHAAGCVSDKCHAARQMLLRDIAHQRAEMGSAPSPIVARALRQLELFALCSGSTVAPHWQVRKSVSSSTAPVPKQVKAILRRLNMPVTSIGARRVLTNLNRYSTPGYRIVWRDEVERQTTLMQVPDLASAAGNSNGSRVMESTGSTEAARGKKAVSRSSATLRNAEVNEVAAASGGRDSDAQTLAGGEYVQNLTPWSAAVAEEARRLALAVDRDRHRLADTEVGSPGKRGPSGRMDYRGTATAHPALCVDARYASFLDDALSLSPETGELLVHVVDVAGKIRNYQALQQVAKERVSTAFLPSGPLHMLPPTALSALGLTSEAGAVNEVLTAALSVDYETGEILSFRMFPALLGPVFPMDMRTANEIISSVLSESPPAIEAAGRAGLGGAGKTAAASGPRKVTGKVKDLRFPVSSLDTLSARVGFPAAVIRDLQTAHHLVEKICAKHPWLDASLRTEGKLQTDWQYDAHSGKMRRVEAGGGFSQRLVNALLSLYSASALEFCTSAEANKRSALPVPIAWENRDREDSSKVRRFATQPLRNWISQLQQKQLRAALRMELPLTEKECAMAVLHHNLRRKQLSPYADRRSLFLSD